MAGKIVKVSGPLVVATGLADANMSDGAYQQKMAEGRLEKYYKENCLTEQDFVKDTDKTIKAYTDEVAKNLGGTIKVKDFIRFSLGD